MLEYAPGIAKVNTDIRIAIGLTSNPKVLKLMKRCGDRSFFCLISLWTWAAQNRPDGNLEGMDAEDVELSSKWTGAEGCFVGCLKDLRFIDQEPDGSFSIHDWAENNPWAAEAKERSEAARLSRLFRKNPGAAQMLKTQGRVGITPDEYQLYVRETKEERTKYDRTANPSTPAPVPVPAPDPEPTPKEVCTKTLLKDLPDSANRAGAVDADDEIFYLSKKKKKLKAEVLESFNRFWKAFAYSHGKAEAADAWLSVYSPGMVEPAVNAAIFEAQSRPEQIAKGKTPKWAQGWLTGRRWEDGADGQVTGRCGSCFHEKSPSCASKNAAQRIGCAYFSEVKP